MESTNIDLLIIILSVGFVILVIFVCVAIGAAIKIMLDVKRITAVGRREAENIADTFDALGNKAKNILTNSLVLDKVIPSILGAITLAMGAKKVADDNGYSFRTRKQERKKTRRKGSRRSNIFSDEEID